MALLKLAAIACLVLCGGCSAILPFDFEVRDGDAGSADAAGADALAIDSGPIVDASPPDVAPLDGGDCPTGRGGWSDPFGIVDVSSWMTYESGGNEIFNEADTMVLRAPSGAMAAGASGQRTVVRLDLRNREAVLDIAGAPTNEAVSVSFDIVFPDTRWVSIEQTGTMVQGWSHDPSMPSSDQATAPSAAIPSGRFRIRHACGGQVEFFAGTAGAEASLGSLAVDADFGSVTIGFGIYNRDMVALEARFVVDAVSVPAD